jgi:hypothetical protein
MQTENSSLLTPEQERNVKKILMNAKKPDTAKMALKIYLSRFRKQLEEHDITTAELSNALVEGAFN